MGWSTVHQDSSKRDLACLDQKDTRQLDQLERRAYATL